MTEQGPSHPEPRVYWHEDIELAKIAIGDEPAIVRMQVHQEEEKYRQREVLFEQRNRRGVRDYLAAHFYYLVPEITVTAELYPSPREGAVGEVIAAEQTGMRRQALGSAQAWHYHEDNVTVLWECILHEWVRKENPVEDPTYQHLWQAFEQHLVGRFQPERIYTPGWEPMFDDELWRQFLLQQGYAPQPRRAFVKEIPRPRDSQPTRRFRS